MNKIIISHRGNTSGPNSAPSGENSPNAIDAALAAGFDVEIDLRINDNGWFLGHDAPQYKIYPGFIQSPRLWVHCKDLRTLSDLIDSLRIVDPKSCPYYFFHGVDDGVLTPGDFIFTAPGKDITPYSIAVLPETVPDWDISLAAGVCTDFPHLYAKDSR